MTAINIFSDGHQLKKGDPAPSTPGEELLRKWDKLIG